MSRWLVWFALVLGLCAWIFAVRTTDGGLLEDSDTSALLRETRAAGDPWVWFRGDWPLKNHFYRPVSTLTFEIDDRLSGGAASVFGTTNALFAIGCVLVAFWLFRELTDSPTFTGLATLVFGLWHVNEQAFRLLETGFAWLGAVCLLGVVRGGSKNLLGTLLAAASCLFLSSQLLPVEEFLSRIVHWLPGRTASVMVFFALVSLASYARFVRLTGKAVDQEATSMDVPATKGTRLSATPRAPWLWLAVCFVSLILALGSYEQAIVLPGLLVGVWLVFRLRGRNSVWWPLVVVWVVLVGYLVLRENVLPPGASGYQQQQFRTGPGVWITLGDYSFPGIFASYLSLQGATLLTVVLFENSLLSVLAFFAGQINVLVKGWGMRDHRWLLIGFLALAFGAFMPMAWLKPFGHYHYLSSVFRAGYTVALSTVTLRLVASAVSLPEIRAPRRRDPAPGSLLRP